MSYLDNFKDSWPILKNKMKLEEHFNIGRDFTYFDNGLFFQSEVGLLEKRSDIDIVIHEFCHFLISPYYKCLYSGFGLRNRNVLFSGIGVDKISNNKSQLKLECKVWAYQLFIEKLCDFRDYIPERTEAVYLDEMLYLNKYDTIKDFIKNEIENEYKKIRIEKISDKIKNFPMFVHNLKSDYEEKEIILDRTCFNGMEHIIKYNIDCYGNYIMSVEIENCTEEEVLITTDISKIYDLKNKIIENNPFVYKK